MLTDLLAKLLLKLTKKLEGILFSQAQLPSNVKIHPSSEFELTKLRLKPGCSVMIDEQSQVSGHLFFDKDNAFISIGKRVFMNGQVIAAKSIDIGNDVLISWGVTIIDHNSHSISFSHRSEDVLNWRLGKKTGLT